MKRAKQTASQPEAGEAEPEPGAASDPKPGSADPERGAARRSAEVPGAKRRKLLERAKGLISRAAHEGTPEEEARTSALVGARIIHAEKLLDPPPRHPIIDRLDALEDDVLDQVGAVLEDLLSTWSPDVRRKPKQTAMEIARWQAEARAHQQRFQLHVLALRSVLETGRIGLAERVVPCGACGRPIRRGEMIAWRRRRGDAIHYVCFVENLTRRQF